MGRSVQPWLTVRCAPKRRKMPTDDRDPQPRAVGTHARRVAVVGAGVAGLVCARVLHERGVEVAVFDKGRSPGGRLATRRVDGFAFDLGAQYFTARDPRFRRWVTEWLTEGVVRRWSGRIGSVTEIGAAIVETAPVERFVAVPDMPELARRLASELDVRSSRRVDVVERHGAKLVLRGVVGAPGETLGPRVATDAAPGEALGEFDALVVALPPAQARALVGSVSSTIDVQLASVVLDPCVALGVGIAEGSPLTALPFDGIFVGRDGDAARTIAWISRDSSKPGRPRQEAWVIHAAPEWSRAHLRDADASIAGALLDALSAIAGHRVASPIVTTLQRWSFARPRDPLAVEGLFDDEARVGVGGDWAAGGRVEGAFLSGLALANRVGGWQVGQK